MHALSAETAAFLNLDVLPPGYRVGSPSDGSRSRTCSVGMTLPTVFTGMVSPRKPVFRKTEDRTHLTEGLPPSVDPVNSSKEALKLSSTENSKHIHPSSEHLTLRSLQKGAQKRKSENVQNITSTSLPRNLASLSAEDLTKENVLNGNFRGLSVADELSEVDDICSLDALHTTRGIERDSLQSLSLTRAMVDARRDAEKAFPQQVSSGSIEVQKTLVRKQLQMQQRNVSFSEARSLSRREFSPNFEVPGPTRFSLPRTNVSVFSSQEKQSLSPEPYIPVNVFSSKIETTQGNFHRNARCNGPTNTENSTTLVRRNLNFSPQEKIPQTTPQYTQNGSFQIRQSSTKQEMRQKGIVSDQIPLSQPTRGLTTPSTLKTQRIEELPGENIQRVSDRERSLHPTNHHVSAHRFASQISSPVMKTPDDSCQRISEMKASFRNFMATIPGPPFVVEDTDLIKHAWDGKKLKSNSRTQRLWSQFKKNIKVWCRVEKKK